MATYTVSASAHAKTLAANAVDTVTFSVEPGNVEIISDGAAAIYYTLDGTDPTVGGDGCRVLPAGGMSVDTVPTNSGDSVKLISAGTPTYSVQRATRPSF